MLRIKDLCVNYGNFEALRNTSLHVEQGEIVALLGSNGAGKTTLINAISGIVKVTSGDIEFEGKSILQAPAYERVRMGIVQVPEGRKLFPYMSVYENLMMGSYLPQNRKTRQQNLEMCFEIFPKLAQRRAQLAREPFRRRAADVRHQPRADEQPPHPDARPSPRWALRRWWSTRCLTRSCASPKTA